MKLFWAGLAVAGLAVAGADAKCNCNFLNPRLENPTVGTRFSSMADLTQTKSTGTDTQYLGCDIKFWNIPEGSKLKVVWNYYEGEDDDTPEQKADKSKPESINGNGTYAAQLEDDDGFPDGVFECVFTVESSKKVDNNSAKGRITVGTPKKGGGKAHKKGKSGDDDDDKGSKKKKKGDDDDDDK